MSEGFPAKPTRPVFIVGIARRILVGVADSDLVVRAEIVVDLRVDLLATVAGQSGNSWAHGKDVFAAAVLVAGPSEASGIQTVTQFIVVGHRHLVQKLRYKSGWIDAGPILIPRPIRRRRRP